MGRTEGQPVTRLIEAARANEPGAREQLFDAVYAELKIIARSSRFVGAEGETLQPTVLVSETYLELERRFPVPPRDTPENRATFFRSVALAMRTILRDHWRRQRAE
ncbi:MAG: hypothetical protein KDA28_09335, partial [Phycisphaerales bacterium]|nr:hypothetical protein [Phycisphaerales bacterium]